MNLTINTEVEITNDEIKAIVKKEVRDTIHRLVVAQVKSWGAEQTLKSRVMKVYDNAIDEMIKAEFANSVILKERVTKEIEAKLRRQITAIAKAGGA